ncbi:hypothetical protein MTR67_050137 [Solanum verrucosum]|uniref:Chalcone/stilbene synthase C-terminal domain-containing protein n=1 Tax=Solanum verrucosum TaxID=315347 RepID=A0AAF0V1T8_SOLVR|nr:hypothetical protein MTR67_050137 [Solanum verrucosum]
MIKCLCSNLPPSAKLVTIEELSRAQRAKGPANVLAIGTANPSNCTSDVNIPGADYQIELKLGLKPEKLKATRHVLSDYGNMSSATVLFVLDEMKKTSINKGLCSTGEGLEWGVLCCFWAWPNY